jgi:peptide/nickel transport system permease protein
LNAYIVRRILAIVPVLFLVSCITFLMLYLVPGDPVDALMAQTQGTITPEERAAIREQLGLNEPIPVRYVHWLTRAVQGDLGTSISSGQPVVKLILSRLPSTLELAFVGVGIAIVFGFALGTLAALNRGKLIDTLTMSIAMTGVSMPSFWLGLLLLLAFAVKLHWFPVISGNGWLGLVLPALTLGYQASAIISRLTRSCLIDVLSQDYVATARAKGLRESRVIWAHALKNTLIPVITIIGLQFGSLLGGAIIVETVFVRQGIGQLLVHGIQQRDFPVVQGTILFIAVAYLLVNLAVDLLYGFIDPRTRYS